MHLELVIPNNGDKELLARQVGIGQKSCFRISFERHILPPGYIGPYKKIWWCVTIYDLILSLNGNQTCFFQWVLKCVGIKGPHSTEFTFLANAKMLRSSDL